MLGRRNRQAVDIGGLAHGPRVREAAPEVGPSRVDQEQLDHHLGGDERSLVWEALSSDLAAFGEEELELRLVGIEHEHVSWIRRAVEHELDQRAG